MNKSSFILYHSYRKHLDLLTNEQKGVLLDSIFKYSESGTVEPLEPVIMMAFNFIREDIDINKAKWEETKEIRSEAGRMGAKARWQKMAKDSKRILPMANNSKNAVNVNDKDNVNDSDSVIDISNDIGVETPPVVEEESYGNQDVNKLIRVINLNLPIKLPEKDVNARRYVSNMLKLLTRSKDREWMDEDKWKNARAWFDSYLEFIVKDRFYPRYWKTVYESVHLWIANKGDLSKLNN